MATLIALAARQPIPVAMPTCRYESKVLLRNRMIDRRFRGAVMHEVSLVRLTPYAFAI